MEAYEKGGHAYHATMPTDALARLRDAMKETERFGFEHARAAQQELGSKVRALLAQHGMPSVAAPGFEAPGVVVSYTDDTDIQTGKQVHRARACRPPPACRCSATSPPTSGPSASACSASTSSATSIAPVSNLERALDEIASPALAAR